MRKTSEQRKAYKFAMQQKSAAVLRREIKWLKRHLRARELALAAK